MCGLGSRNRCFLAGNYWWTVRPSGVGHVQLSELISYDTFHSMPPASTAGGCERGGRQASPTRVLAPGPAPKPLTITDAGGRREAATKTPNDYRERGPGARPTGRETARTRPPEAARPQGTAPPLTAATPGEGGQESRRGGRFNRGHSPQVTSGVAAATAIPSAALSDTSSCSAISNNRRDNAANSRGATPESNSSAILLRNATNNSRRPEAAASTTLGRRRIRDTTTSNYPLPAGNRLMRKRL
jgi:hypothetical protein